MEITYDVGLPESVSQVCFGELKTWLAVTIKNAEALPALTNYKVWWSELEGKYYIDCKSDFYDFKLDVEEAITQSVIKVVMLQKNKDVAVDIAEIVRSLIQEKEKEEKEEKEREIKELKEVKNMLEKKQNEIYKYVRRLIRRVDDAVLREVFEFDIEDEDERALTELEERVMSKLFDC